MTLRVVVVDDEEHARETLVHHLHGEEDVRVVARCGSGREGLRAIREHAPELVFLDIRMPDMDGFEMLAELDSDELPFVVFVTAFDEHALEAFRHHALAYLLKPFDDVRFAETMQHVRRLLERPIEELRGRLLALAGRASGSAAPHSDEEGPVSRFVVRSGRRSIVVPVEEIRWIEAEGDYVRLHSDSGVHLMGRGLSEVEAALDSRRFVRIHRSTVVALDRIRELRTENRRDFEVLLESGDVLRLSRTYREELERALGDRI